MIVEAGPGLRLHVFDLGLACCAVEVAAAVRADGALAALDAQDAPDGPANVLVISGTVTDVAADAVRHHYDRLDEPRYVVSFGACANTGGPYWDSYAVTNGVASLVPVDVWVAGCPPRPEALLSALAALPRR